MRRRRRESSRTATKRCGGFVNEGIRVSRLLAFIGEQDYPPERKALVDELAAPARVEMPGPLPAENLDFRVTVFTGPVLAADDAPYRGVQLPRQFWKVIVMVKTSGELSATAYLVSQEALIKGLEIDLEEFDYGAYRTYQVPVRKIEELTRLSFGTLRDADPLERTEALVTEPTEIARLEDIEL